MNNTPSITERAICRGLALVPGMVFLAIAPAFSRVELVNPWAAATALVSALCLYIAVKWVG